jgi:DNA-binding HxlR family transcriptional regulator
LEPAEETAPSYRHLVEQVFAMLNGGWDVAALAALAGGPRYFAEVHAAINEVEDNLGQHLHPNPLSRSQLVRTLKRLEAAGLVSRHDVSVSHPSVWYELTQAGGSLVRALRPLAEWARHNLPADLQTASYRQLLEHVLTMLDGGWDIAALSALAAGPRYFTQLHTDINAVDRTLGRATHPKPLHRPQLVRTLRRLESAGLVSRHDVTVSHPSVWYELTSMGRSLIIQLRPIAEWARDALPIK